MVTYFCFFLASVPQSDGLGRANEPPTEVRVGIVAYQDARDDVDRYGRQLAELAATSPVPLAIRFALGTYGDLLHWMDREYIDVAVLSPGIFAETLKPTSKLARWRYAATLGLPPGRSPLADDARKRPGYHYEYRSICVGPADSAVRSIVDLRRAAEQGSVQFLFVHPLSVSGRIAPEFALKQVGIRVRPEDIEYTYSHSNSLRLVAESREAGPTQSGRTRVAFVWDDPPRMAPRDEERVRKLEFPELAALPLPQNAVAIRPDFEHADVLAKLVAGRRDEAGQPDAKQFDDWRARYEPILTWSREIGMPADAADSQSVSLDELGRIVLHYARTQPRPPRIALVLSGGGAKCAFQVGAVGAIEQRLAALRAAHDEAGLDIGLVVGTSGGAINALPIALGVSSSDAGRADLGRVWRSLDQQEIVRPSRMVRWNMGLWFVSIQAMIVLLLVRRFVATPVRRGWIGAMLLVVLALPEILLAHIPWKPWRVLGSNHLLHHAWLWGTFGARWSAWCMLVLGVAGLALQYWLTQRGRHIAAPTWLVRTILAAAILGLPSIQFVTVMFHEATLTSGAGIEHALAEKLPPLIDEHLKRGGHAPLAIGSAATDAERLRAVSRQIIKRRLLERDLVLTGSCVSKTSPELPSDLYFHAAADPDRPAPAFGSLGVPLAHYPDRVVDVIMGSGSIFPVFPPRVLDDFPQPGVRVELVDGGFAHNSPIEAAVLWGATHVILIEASPSAALRQGQRSFLENSIDAFNHLYYQAQRADARSKEKVVIFTLRPDPPHICVLDFANNLVERAIDAGYAKARGAARDGAGTITGRPTFQKELGEPMLLDVPSSP